MRANPYTASIEVEHEALNKSQSWRFQTRKHIGGITMKTKLIAALLIASSAALAAPAFASGLGPAPFYRPDVGAPASQRGQSAQTLEAEQRNAAAQASDVGGVQAGESHGAARATLDDSIYRGR
jgi:hypothetical protein